MFSRIMFSVLILVASVLSLGSITFHSELFQLATPSETLTAIATQSLTPSASPTATATPSPSTTLTPTSSGTITISPSLTLSPSATPSMTASISPAFSPSSTSPLQTVTPTFGGELPTIPAVQTAAIIPLPTITLLFPVKSATPVLLFAERQPGADELTKSPPPSLARRLFKLWPLGLLMLIWLTLGLWFILAQLQME